MSDPEAATSDSIKPWSIRGVEPEARNAALAAAKRDGLPIGEWLGRAIRSHIQGERRAVLPIAPEVTQPPPPRLTMDEISTALTTAERLAALTGKPVSRRIARAVTRGLLSNLGG